MFTKPITACSLRQSALGSMPNEFLDYQNLLETGMANENSVWSLMGDCFGRLWSSIIYPIKFPITSRVLGPRFCLGAIILQMAWFFCILTKFIHLGAFGCIVSSLPVHKKGFQGRGEGSDGTVTWVMILCDQYLLVNVFTEDFCDLIVGRTVSPYQTNCLNNICLVGPGSISCSVDSLTCARKSVQTFPGCWIRLWK